MTTKRFRFSAQIAVTLLALFGMASLSRAVTVTSSALDHIEIAPYGKPYNVELNTDQQFVAYGYTKDETRLAGITFSWSVSDDIGKVTPRGILTATNSGTGSLTAQSGSIHKTIGIAVQGPKKTTPVVNATNAAPHAKTTVTEQAVPKRDDGKVLGTETTESQTTSAEKNTSCSFLPAWAWILILLAYIIIVGIYFVSLGESRTMFWWVWPLLLTAELFVLYWFVHCAGSQKWVVWLLGLAALMMGFFYIRILRPKDFERTALPPTSS